MKDKLVILFIMHSLYYIKEETLVFTAMQEEHVIVVISLCLSQSVYNITEENIFMHD